MALRDRLEEIAANLDGTLGLAVRVLKTGEEYRINDQELFPLASVFKVPLLVELFRQMEQGGFSLETRVTLRAEDQSPGSGVLKEFLPGAQLSIWDLAVLMIIVSDNTATDMLYERIHGATSITRSMKALGLNHTAVPFDCKALLNVSVGLESADRSPDTMEEGRRRLKEGAFDYESVAFQCTLENNCTTPADMLELFTMIEQRAVVSPEACDKMIDILLRQQLNQRIPLLLPQPFKVAHKTGTVGTTRNDAGIIYLPSGDPVVFCAFTKGVDPTNWRAGDMAIAEAALAVYQEYAR
ncbi:MAG: serine hydrolase [Bacillota bacterium]